jgi:hypothetical protein
METHDYRVEGPVMLMLTTTAIDVDPELLNRCLVLTVDEEAGQTAAIQQSQREARTLAGIQAKRERSAIEALHRNAQRLLSPVAVVNPHAPALSFAAHQTRLRRDHAKYLALIDAVAFLHQHQRERKTAQFADGSTFEYIEVTKADIAMAGELAAVVLGWSVDELPPQSRRLLDAVRAYVAAEAQQQGIPAARVMFDRRGLAAAIGWTYKQVRRHLDRLAEDEFVVVGGMGFGQVLRYRLAVPDDVGPSGLGLHATAPAPTATTNALPMQTPVCPPLAQGLPMGDGQGQHAEKSAVNAANKGGLPMTAVFTTGGMQPDASYVGTDAPPVVVFKRDQAAG